MYGIMYQSYSVKSEKGRANESGMKNCKGVTNLMLHRGLSWENTQPYCKNRLQPANKNSIELTISQQLLKVSLMIHFSSRSFILKITQEQDLVRTQGFLLFMHLWFNERKQSMLIHYLVHTHAHTYTHSHTAQMTPRVTCSGEHREGAQPNGVVKVCTQNHEIMVSIPRLPVYYDFEQKTSFHIVTVHSVVTG